MFKRPISWFIIITFIVSLISPYKPAQAAVLGLPAPGAMVHLSNAFAPPTLEGIKVYPNNPLKIDFIVDAGDDHLQGEALKKESNKLIKYFMAALTVPKSDMWVNLSPYEKNRIIADGLGNTEMGRDMLAQDYILKQLSASLLYPEHQLGREFWQKVYAKAQQDYGTTNIPINTFNKIWIIPQSASVYVNGTKVFIVDSHLKVMLEEDYVALKNNALGKNMAQHVSGVSSAVVREVLIPAIEKEVNEGKNFAPLRQIYNSMILATWYKQNLRASLLGEAYVDQNKTAGVDVSDKQIKLKIYNQYLQAYKKGVYNFIKEEYDGPTHQSIPRKYFSGGEDFAKTKVNTVSDYAMLIAKEQDHSLSVLDVNLGPTTDQAMISNSPQLTPKEYIQYIQEHPESKDKLVLIVGTGPAGLRAGELLLKEGYRLAYFEKNATLSGLGGYGIPDAGSQTTLKNNMLALGYNVLAAELGNTKVRPPIGAKSDKVEMFFNIKIGQDISLTDLEATNVPIFIATGAHNPRRLGVAGENLEQVVNATHTYFRKLNTEDYLNRQPEIDHSLTYEGKPWHYGNNVIVYGGGNVASDAILAAHRYVAPSENRHLTLAYRGPIWAMANMESNYFNEIARANAEENAGINLLGLRQVEEYKDGVGDGKVHSVVFRKYKVTGLKLDAEGKPQILNSGVGMKPKPLELPTGKTMRDLLVDEGVKITEEIEAQLSQITDNKAVYQVNVEQIQGSEGLEEHPVDLMIEAIGDQVEAMEGLKINNKGALDGEANTGRVPGKKMWIIGQAFTQRGAIAHSFVSAGGSVKNFLSVMKDPAMTTPKNGGIDFNEDHLNLGVQGNTIKFKMSENFNGIELQKINGLTPVIIKILPVDDFASFVTAP